MQLLRRIGRALRRVFPRAGLYAQALAFNLFLTLFPVLLLVVSLLAGSRAASFALEELLRDRWMLPASSRDVIFPYLHQHNVNPGRWLIIGLIGTILAGSQCMSVLLESFRMMEGAARRTFWNRCARRSSIC